MTRPTERPSPQSPEPQTWPDRVRSQRDKAGRPLTIEELMQSSLEYRAAQRAQQAENASGTAPAGTMPAHLLSRS